MMDFFKATWRITNINANIASPVQESFKLFLNVIHNENNIFEVPFTFANRLMASSLDNINNKKVVIILRRGGNGDNATYSTSKAILNAFMSNATNGCITKAITPKGKVYYGCEGLILDEDFQPLYMETVKLQRIPSSNESIVNNPIIRVSPRVFDNCTGVIEKAIIKGIPLFTRNLINIYGGNQFCGRDLKADIQIEELGDWIVIPSTPNIHNCTNSCFNKVLQ